MSKIVCASAFLLPIIAGLMSPGKAAANEGPPKTVAALEDAPVRATIVQGIKAVLAQEDIERDGILTVFDNDLFVQCLNSHFLKTWRCEAAGLEGQPWLRNVLTPARQEELIRLTFIPNPANGNFVSRFPKDTPADALAELILRVLVESYGADGDNISVEAEQIKSARCHARAQPGGDRGGSILTPKTAFAQYADKGCRMASRSDPFNYDDPAEVMPSAAGIDIDARYGAAMATQLQRLENAKHGVDAYAIFEAGPAYVQCMYDDEGDRMYCEAVSEDAVGKPIERILTPARKAKLAEAGFEPPGKVMNYRRFYPRAEFDMPAVATALLDVLRQAYGYQGAPPIMVKIEKGGKQPLAP